MHTLLIKDRQAAQWLWYTAGELLHLRCSTFDHANCRSQNSVSDMIIEVFQVGQNIIRRLSCVCVCVCVCVCLQGNNGEQIKIILCVCVCVCLQGNNGEQIKMIKHEIISQLSLKSRNILERS